MNISEIRNLTNRLDLIEGLYDQPYTPSKNDQKIREYMINKLNIHESVIDKMANLLHQYAVRDKVFKTLSHDDVLRDKLNAEMDEINQTYVRMYDNHMISGKSIDTKYADMGYGWGFVAMEDYSPYLWMYDYFNGHHPFT